MTYLRRTLDNTMDELAPHLPAIAIEGAKGVGKTATALRRCASELQLDNPRQREVLEAHPDLIRDLAPPLLIDEWQLYPPIWDFVRREVDRDPSGGRFLLTGSATAAPGTRIHTGAGRITRFLMRPLTVHERGLTEATVSLRSLLSGDSMEIGGKSPLSLTDYVEEILRSGFPGIRDLPQKARDVQLDAYIDRIVDHELTEAGVTVRRPTTVMAWLRAYAAATSTDASWSAILNSATAGESDKPARSTADVYRDHLTRIFILDPLPAWTPSFSPLKRLTVTPKHHLADPALAARLVGVSARGLLSGEGNAVSPRTGTWLGALFESLATQSVRVAAEATQAHAYHARTKNTEREIDLIVEGDDLSVVAIEVKLAPVVSDADVRHLNWLHTQLGDRLVARVVINTGEFAYRRPDGVIVVPLALFGP